MLPMVVFPHGILAVGVAAAGPYHQVAQASLGVERSR
jgi:hypothetical protein